MRIVVSVGGNALTPAGGSGTYKELVANIRKVTKVLPAIIRKHEVVLVYGSGPQIGNLVLQAELTKSTVPSMPLDVLDAELQGELGYLFEQSLQNELSKQMVKRSVVSLITQVIVDQNDKGFRNPTKPIGPFYTRAEAVKLEKQGYRMVLQKGKGYRRVVASPKPVEIDDVELIRSLVKKVVVIAAGGGGIPVVRRGKKLIGVAAVIDKDRASALLAAQVKAEVLVIVTDIDKVYVQFGEKNQRPVRSMSVSEAEAYLATGEFPAGSMGPKIEAAVSFVKAGGKKVVITSPRFIGKALKGGGTVITR